MSNPGRSSSSAVIRIAVIVILAIAVVAVLKLRGKSITEEEARAMIASRELVGLPAATAALKLQHNVEPMVDGALICDFSHIKGWSAGPVILEIKAGDVTAAFFESDPPKAAPRQTNPPKDH